MSTVADFSVPADAFCLGEALQTVPDAMVELDRLVAHSPDFVMPFLWVMDTDQGVFDDALSEDPTVVTAEVTDSFDEAYLYQIDWADVVDERLHVILDHEGVILEARGVKDEWRFWVRFGSRDHFADFRDHFQQHGEVTLHQMRQPENPGKIMYGVTEKQREALLTGYDAGYYDHPRTATGEEVAQQLGITQQALSVRLRRGVHTLLENTLNRHR